MSIMPLFDAESLRDETGEVTPVGKFRGYASEAFFEAECLERDLLVASPSVDIGVDRIVGKHTVQVKRAYLQRNSLIWHIFVSRQGSLASSRIAKGNGAITDVDFYALHVAPDVCGEHRWWIVPSPTIAEVCAPSGLLSMPLVPNYRVRSTEVLSPYFQRWDLLGAITQAEGI